MAKKKLDGVVEAVHYRPGGLVDWVRIYLRRGPVFSDRIMLDRQTLIEQLNSGKQYLAGKRVPRMGGTFEVSKPLRVLQRNGVDLLVVGDVQAEEDCLEGVPVI